MLAISGQLVFEPEDREMVAAGLREVSERSRQDAGCIEYWWAEDLETPGAFRFFECWQDEETFAAHRGQPYEHEFEQRYLSRVTGATAFTYTIGERASATG